MSTLHIKGVTQQGPANHHLSMLVPNLGLSSSSSVDHDDDGRVPFGVGEAEQQAEGLVAPLQLRLLVAKPGRAQLKDYVYSRMAKNVLKHIGAEYTTCSIQELAYAIHNLVHRLECSPVCLLIASYYLGSIDLNVFRCCESISAGLHAARIVFAGLMVAISLNECSFRIIGNDAICAVHGADCGHLDHWYDLCQDIFDSELEMHLFETTVFNGLKGTIPITISDLEYHVETQLTSHREHSDQLVPGGIHYIYNCFKKSNFMHFI